MQETHTEEDEILFQYIEHEAYIDPTVEVEYPPVAISYGDWKGYPTPIGTYGNFSFVQAPPKTFKTYFMSLLSTAYLAGSNESCGKIKGHRGNKKLVHFDTEQGKFHAQKVFKRPLDMIGDNNTDNYITFGLREFDHESKVKFIEYYINKHKDEIGLVIIDGVADLMTDTNDNTSSSLLAQKIMTWTSTTQCHIITVIHTVGSGEKPTGHLGSYLEKKAETQIHLERNTQNEGWITVKCKRSRNVPFDTFSFRLNDKTDLPEVINEDDLYDVLDGVDFDKPKEINKI